MPTGFTAITASKIQDCSGHLLSSGRIHFFPVNSSGGPVSAIAGGGGPITQSAVTFLVVNGEITTDLFGNAPQLADTTLTSPTNIVCYAVVITDATGTAVQGPGYGLVQPSGSTWSLDSYVPVLPVQPALVTLQPTLNPFSMSATATAGQTVFTLPYVPTMVFGFVNRLLQVGSPTGSGADYALPEGSTTVTFNFGLEAGDIVFFQGLR